MTRGLFSAYSSLIIFTFASGEVCKPAPEIMYLHDASGSLKPDSQQLFDEILELMDYFDKKYTGVKFGYSSWTDKPMPFRGYGSRTWGGDLDRCYFFGTGLTNDAASVRNAINETFAGYGGDARENPYEAMLDGTLDPRIGWTPWNDGAQLPDGRMPVRAIVLATDDLPHLAGDAAAGAAHYNRSRYPKDLYFPGGFGHKSVLNYSAGVYTCDVDGEPCTNDNYFEMCDLMYKKDVQDLTDEETKALNDHIYIFGPPTWPEILDHPGEFNDDLTFCNTHEYPSIAQVVAPLLELHITPILLLKSPGFCDQEGRKQCIEAGYGDPTEPDQYLECMKKFYLKEFTDAGLVPLIQEYTGANDLRDTLQGVIDTVARMQCDDPSSSTTTTSTSTSTTTTTSSHTPTISTKASDSSSVPANADDGSGGSNTAAIIGGAAGGAAGLIGIGALVYRKVNGGFFERSESNLVSMVSNEVSWPQNARERESTEEVTTDMFQ